MTATALIMWGAGQNWWIFMDKYGGNRHKKTDVHITLDQDVLQELARLDVIRSRFINGMLRWLFFKEEPSPVVRLLISGHEKAVLVPRPGFEPGARARKARMFDRATPPGRRYC